MGLQYRWALLYTYTYNTSWPTVKNMWAHSTCETIINESLLGLLYIWAYYPCGPSTHAGLQYMWAYKTCGPTEQVGLLYMWAHITCGPTVHGGPTVHVGPQYMWAYCTCGLSVHVCPLSIGYYGSCRSRTYGL